MLLDSIVCSGEEAIRRVIEAIDELEAGRAAMDAPALAVRIAAIWSMVAEIHPDLARLASRYRDQPGQPPDQDS
jgi:hypothetical protein